MSVRDRLKMFEQKAKEGTGAVHSRSHTIAGKRPVKFTPSVASTDEDTSPSPTRVSPAVKRRSRTAGDLGATAAAAVASVQAEQARAAAGSSDAGRVKRLSTMLGGLNIPYAVHFDHACTHNTNEPFMQTWQGGYAISKKENTANS